MPTLYCVGLQPVASAPNSDVKDMSKLDIVLALTHQGFKPARDEFEIAWFPDGAHVISERMLLKGTKLYFLALLRRGEILERGAQYINHDGPVAYFRALLSLPDLTGVQSLRDQGPPSAAFEAAPTSCASAISRGSCAPTPVACGATADVSDTSSWTSLGAVIARSRSARHGISAVRAWTTTITSGWHPTRSRSMHWRRPSSLSATAAFIAGSGPRLQECRSSSLTDVVPSLSSKHGVTRTLCNAPVVPGHQELMHSSLNGAALIWISCQISAQHLAHNSARVLKRPPRHLAKTAGRVICRRRQSRQMFRHSGCCMLRAPPSTSQYLATGSVCEPLRRSSLFDLLRVALSPLQTARGVLAEHGHS